MKLQMPDPNPKQAEFFLSRTKYTAYGGARGGGKSHAIRWKATLGALKKSGIKILIIRRSYPELKENHILPLMEILNGLAKYNDTDKAFNFPNKSRIKLGYCDTEKDTLQYQGQEYDWIFIDEATQLDFETFEIFKACLRGVNKFGKRIYLTCNPGGKGHAWVKRLFIDREFEEKEKPEEYSFIQATVYDNTALLKAQPDYVDNLESLTGDKRKAWLEGSWDIYEGQFFTEFKERIHVIPPFSIPPEWRRFRCLDYGLDTTCCLWCAVDRSGKVYVYRELHKPDLTLSVAAEMVIEMTRPDEDIEYTVASPDLWNRRQDRGESGVEIMMKNGLGGLRRAKHKRIPGWRVFREYLQAYKENGKDTARLQIFDTCTSLIKSIPALIHSDKNNEDAADEPHKYTHAPEAMRYGLMSRPPLTIVKQQPEERLPDRGERSGAKRGFLGSRVNVRGLMR